MVVFNLFCFNLFFDNCGEFVPLYQPTRLLSHTRTVLTMYFTKTQTRELHTVDFALAYKLYKDAAEVALVSAQEDLNRVHCEKIEELEQAYTDSHEAPYEGNFNDQFAEPQVDFATAKKLRYKHGSLAITEDFIPRFKLDTLLQTYLFPQILRYITRNFSNNMITEVSTVEGKIDSKKLLPKIFDPTSDWDKGLYCFLMLDSRSSYLKSQYKGEAKNYCALVPLIPYAFKLLHDIPYSQWDRETIELAVNPGLASAMLCEPQQLTREELLQIRDQGLTFQAGTKRGQTRKPETTYKLYSIQETALGKLPLLAQTMLTQTWCAHPVNRTKYMILDPLNWDRLPAPLVTEDIFGNSSYQPTTVARAETKPYNPNLDLPWNL